MTIYRKDKDGEILTNQQFWFKWGKMYPDRGGCATMFDELPEAPVLYDSQVDTLLHIKRVNSLLIGAATELLQRAAVHDDSKLRDTEKETFDRMTPKLKGCEYGSPEYKGFLTEMKPALKHHYANNSHHPEHYAEGVNGMNIFDVLEMFLAWKAASERHETGNIYKSIELNKKRFGLSDQLCKIFENTAKHLGFVS